ncbi:AP-4 complex subunit mu-1 [Dispira simplex]|nr:AP-4 complex subunit mu-1 [Dispira simplex]
MSYLIVLSIDGEVLLTQENGFSAAPLLDKLHQFHKPTPISSGSVWVNMVPHVYVLINDDVYFVNVLLPKSVEPPTASGVSPPRQGPSGPPGATSALPRHSPLLNPVTLRDGLPETLSSSELSPALAQQPLLQHALSHPTTTPTANPLVAVARDTPTIHTSSSSLARPRFPPNTAQAMVLLMRLVARVKQHIKPLTRQGLQTNAAIIKMWYNELQQETDFAPSSAPEAMGMVSSFSNRAQHFRDRSHSQPTARGTPPRSPLSSPRSLNPVHQLASTNTPSSAPLSAPMASMSVYLDLTENIEMAFDVDGVTQRACIQGQLTLHEECSRAFPVEVGLSSPLVLASHYPDPTQRNPDLVYFDTYKVHSAVDVRSHYPRSTLTFDVGERHQPMDLLTYRITQDVPVVFRLFCFCDDIVEHRHDPTVSFAPRKFSTSTSTNASFPVTPGTVPLVRNTRAIGPRHYPHPSDRSGLRSPLHWSPLGSPSFTALRTTHVHPPTTYSMDLHLSIRSDFHRDISAEDLVLTFPLPVDTTQVVFLPAPSNSSVVWQPTFQSSPPCVVYRASLYPGGLETRPSFRVFSESAAVHPAELGPINLSFHIPRFTATGLKVVHFRVIPPLHKEPLPINRMVRSMTFAENYRQDVSYTPE